MPLKGLPGVLGEHNLEENNRLNEDRVPKHDHQMRLHLHFPHLLTPHLMAELGKK